MVDVAKEIRDVKALMLPITEDNTVPKNIRRVVSEASDKLSEDSDDISVNIATAIYMLDEISNDINMPSHTRTQIWNIISNLEKLKDDLEKK
ncbi:hypothetical protein DRN74_00980 [Candidatus Micrarchaeota archaeon]|nr:MAG: hypothetical protein DRN74_00980 [Candidatus Micrarchaeota archaeon]